MKIRSRLTLISLALLGTTAFLASCGGEKEASETGEMDEVEEVDVEEVDTAEDLEETGE